ncbi:MAG: cadherin repeat domain-containing protein, partial [Henriciella sp.]
SNNTSRQTVTVSVTDVDESEGPVFKDPNDVDKDKKPSYSFNYPENQVAGAPLGTVLATASASVTYAIISGNGSEFFEIGETDGVIALTSSGVRSFANDFELDPNTHILQVQALSGSKQSTIEVALVELDVDELGLKLDEIADPLRVDLRRYAVRSLGDMLSFNETLMRDRNLSQDQCDALADGHVSGRLDATQDSQMAELGFASRLDDCRQWYRAYVDGGVIGSSGDGNSIVRGLASVRIEADLDQSITLGAGLMTSFAADRLNQFQNSRISDETLQVSLYGRKQINDRLRATGFVALGGAWYDFELREDELALKGEMSGLRQVFGAALTGDIQLGSTVVTTDIILSHATEDLGDAELDVIYLEESRSDIDFQVGRVDVTRLSIPVSIPFVLKRPEYEGGDQVRLELSPGLLCEDMSAYGSTLECGYQAGAKLLIIDGPSSYGYIDGSYERADDIERSTFAIGWARRFGPRKALEAGLSLNGGAVDGRSDARMMFEIKAAR